MPQRNLLVGFPRVYELVFTRVCMIHTSGRICSKVCRAGNVLWAFPGNLPGYEYYTPTGILYIHILALRTVRQYHTRLHVT